MYDFLTWQDLYYRMPQQGEFNTTHIFESSGKNYNSQSEPTILKKWDYDGAELRTDSLLPTKRNKKCKYLGEKERKIELSKMLDDLEVLRAPGLRDIKAVELYVKWRPMLPQWARNDTCPQPTKKVIEVVKEAKRKQRKKGLQKKRNIKIVYNDTETESELSEMEI